MDPQWPEPEEDLSARRDPGLSVAQAAFTRQARAKARIASIA